MYANSVRPVYRHRAERSRPNLLSGVMDRATAEQQVRQAYADYGIPQWATPEAVDLWAGRLVAGWPLSQLTGAIQNAPRSEFEAAVRKAYADYGLSQWATPEAVDLWTGRIQSGWPISQLTAALAKTEGATVPSGAAAAPVVQAPAAVVTLPTGTAPAQIVSTGTAALMPLADGSGVLRFLMPTNDDGSLSPVKLALLAGGGYWLYRTLTHR